MCFIRPGAEVGRLSTEPTGAGIDTCTARQISTSLLPPSLPPAACQSFTSFVYLIFQLTSNDLTPFIKPLCACLLQRTNKMVSLFCFSLSIPPPLFFLCLPTCYFLFAVVCCYPGKLCFTELGRTFPGEGLYTVHSESIQTPSFFPNVVTLQTYSKMD